MACPSHTLSVPSPWVAAHLAPVASGCRATLLDVACGGGRHLRLAHKLGYRVIGIDRDLTGVASLETTPGMTLIAADLEDGRPWPLQSDTFDAVIVTNYLYRPRLPDIVAAVAPGGVLIYETFAAGQERHGRPSNPDFLLQPGELIAAVHGRLTPIAYDHRTCENPTRILQRIVAVGSRHPWLADPPASPGVAR
jgi:SAM-dependent methyltransferase